MKIEVIKMGWKEIIEIIMIVIGALALLALALKGLGLLWKFGLPELYYTLYFYLWMRDLCYTRWEDRGILNSIIIL